MTKVDHYRQTLRTFEDWIPFLLEESGLPGPRANLELVQAVVDEGDEALFLRLLRYGPDEAPTNSPGEFLALCGVVGLGKLLAEGKSEALEMLHQLAADPRWRIREGVRMALERLGQKDMGWLMAEMEVWSRGSLLVQRAAAAALCEPRLLVESCHARGVLRILDQITASLSGLEDRKSAEFKTLRKALGYCWSVAVAALPEEGKPLMENWLVSDDRDVLWIMRQNLRKKRLARMDATWVEKWQAS
jgi:hypothetical protein